MAADRPVRPSLAQAQQALVAAVTGTGDVPPGFDARRLAAARDALLHKRSGEIVRVWPALAHSLGAQFGPAFRDWAARRPTRGALRDGWSFAREQRAAGRLDDAALLELALREVTAVYDGEHPPRPRRWPTARRAGRTLVVGRAGWTRVRWTPAPDPSTGPR